MVTYRVICEKIINNALGKYTAYGICAYSNETGKELAHISDIFLKQDDATAFADKCNSFNVELVHLPVIIEDFLLEQQPTAV